MQFTFWIRCLSTLTVVFALSTTISACDSDTKCSEGESCNPDTASNNGSDLGVIDDQDLGNTTADDSGTLEDSSATTDTTQTSTDTGSSVIGVQDSGSDSNITTPTDIQTTDTNTPEDDLHTADIATDTGTPIPEDIAETADITTPPEDSGTTVPTEKNPLGDSVTLTIEAFEVKPGTERQVCKHINLPAETAVNIVRIHSKMAGTSHHFNLYKVIDGSAFDVVTGKKAEVHDCSPAAEQLAGDAAYIFGAATPERIFDTPTGVAFHLSPGQKMILEQHVINYTPNVVQGGVEVELVFATPEAPIEHHADILWLANWGFYLPPFTEVSDTAMCKMPYDVEIIGVMSHYHELGTKFTVDAWTPQGTTPIYEDDDWAHPKFQEYLPPVSLSKGDGLQWTCTWNNTKPKLVGPGKNSTDEMCITFALGYPKNTLSADPIQCNITN